MNNGPTRVLPRSDNCSRHLLTGVREGTLLRVKQSEQPFYKMITLQWKNKDDLDSLQFIIVKPGDILMLLGQEGLPGHASRYCWMWTFHFLYKDMGRIFMHWDMNDDGEVELDAILERVELP